jgi:hypothetical protein
MTCGAASRQANLRREGAGKREPFVVLPRGAGFRRHEGEGPRTPALGLESQQIGEAPDQAVGIGAQPRSAIEEVLRRVIGGVASASSCAALIGLAATVFALAALASALVVALRVDWTQIAVRVAGSWIAASGLLWLGCEQSIYPTRRSCPFQ